jgi:hypothetical protein
LDFRRGLAAGVEFLLGQAVLLRARLGNVVVHENGADFVMQFGHPGHGGGQLDAHCLPACGRTQRGTQGQNDGVGFFQCAGLLDGYKHGAQVEGGGLGWDQHEIGEPVAADAVSLDTAGVSMMARSQPALASALIRLSSRAGKTGLMAIPPVLRDSAQKQDVACGSMSMTALPSSACAQDASAGLDKSSRQQRCGRRGWTEFRAKGAPDIERFAAKTELYLSELSAALREGRYRPQAVKPVDRSRLALEGGEAQCRKANDVAS